MTALADEPQDERQLLLRIDSLRGRRCRACDAELCGHALLFDIVTGLANDPRCPDCLAAALERPADFVAERVRDYIHHRDCTRAAWRTISGREPDCRYSREAVPNPGSGSRPPAAQTGPDPEIGPVAETYDAGELGCGDLVLELRNRLKRLPPRAVLHVVALDRGAPEDIPAWCSLTGHRLLSARHPDYHIRRKDD